MELVIWSHYSCWYGYDVYIKSDVSCSVVYYTLLWNIQYGVNTITAICYITLRYIKQKHGFDRQDKQQIRKKTGSLEIIRPTCGTAGVSHSNASETTDRIIKVSNRYLRWQTQSFRRHDLFIPHLHHGPNAGHLDNNTNALIDRHSSTKSLTHINRSNRRSRIFRSNLTIIRNILLE